MQDIIVFGRGAYYRGKKTEIERQYHIIGFLDNSVSEVSQEDGIPVYPPEEYARGDHETGILIASIDVFHMYQQLKSLRVEDRLIVFAQDIAPFWDTLEERMSDTDSWIFAKNNSLYFQYDGQDHRVASDEQYQELLRDFLRKADSNVNLLCSLKTEPVDLRFGRGTGTPVDRVYMERFLKCHMQYIRGDVLEMANNKYTKMFGSGVIHSYIGHVYGWNDAIKMNLATGEGITENSMDCFVCTQTIQMIYDLESAVKNIHRLLKPDGTALVTISGISQISMTDYNNWGECWRLTPQSARTLFGKYFDADKIEVYSYGNVKTACCFLYGLSAEFLTETDFLANDEQYPLIIGVRACK